MEFDNEKKFLRLENFPSRPPPPPITFLMVRPLIDKCIYPHIKLLKNLTAHFTFLHSVFS